MTPIRDRSGIQDSEGTRGLPIAVRSRGDRHLAHPQPRRLLAACIRSEYAFDDLRQMVKGHTELWAVPNSMWPSTQLRLRSWRSTRRNTASTRSRSRLKDSRSPITFSSSAIRAPRFSTPCPGLLAPSAPGSRTSPKSPSPGDTSAACSRNSRPSSCQRCGQTAAHRGRRDGRRRRLHIPWRSPFKKKGTPHPGRGEMFPAG